MTQHQPAPGRWQQVTDFISAHPDLFTDEFVYQFYSALRDLADGGSEQVCLTRQARTGPVVVAKNRMTTGANIGAEGGQTPKV